MSCINHRLHCVKTLAEDVVSAIGVVESVAVGLRGSSGVIGNHKLLAGVAVAGCNEAAVAVPVALSNTPVELSLLREEVGVVEAEVDKLGIAVVQTLAGAVVEILPVRFLLACVAIATADVVAHLTELPNHLRTRHENHECCVCAEAAHAIYGLLGLSCSIGHLRVCHTLLVVALLEAHD